MLCIAVALSASSCSSTQSEVSNQIGGTESSYSEESVNSPVQSEDESDEEKQSSDDKEESDVPESEESLDSESVSESEESSDGNSKTEKPGTTETKKSSDTTTKKPSDTTTKKPSDTTTKKPSDTTTKKPSVTTTKKPASQTTVTTTAAKQETETPKPEFNEVYEAEDAVLSSDLYVSGDSGSTAAGRFENESSYITFEVTVPETGMYDITLRSSGIGGYKENYVSVNGTRIGTFTSQSDKYTDYKVAAVQFNKGKNTVRIEKSWGWIWLDKITVSVTESISDSVYNAKSNLVNINSTAETKKLYQFLRDNYGKYVISGQTSSSGFTGNEFKAIYNETGKYPAMLGLDMMDYTPSRVALGASRAVAVDKAVEFAEKGGIVTFCWHWNMPTKYLYSGTDNGNPRWWGGFYTKNGGFDLAKVMNGSDAEGKKLLDEDIKEIARQLNILEEKGIPVLWRPLHEASGGWFWWGAAGADAYKKLWIYLYEELTYTYGCNNLIWVYNGQSADWYPGDQYVDIVGEDIYPGERVYNPQISKFLEATEYGSNRKITALTENGCIFDIDQAVAANSLWAWFCTWEGEFVVNGSSYSEKYTERYMLKKMYTSEYVLTLDELPDIY